MASAICDKIRSGSPEMVAITEHFEGHNGATMEDNESIEDMSKKNVNEGSFVPVIYTKNSKIEDSTMPLCPRQIY